MNDLIVWLDTVEGAGVERVGGKGASLARLSGAGFPVPRGFVVTVAGYHQFQEACRLGETLTALDELPGRAPMSAVREACAPVLARVAGSQLPGAVRAAVSTAFARLKGECGSGATFAVRSSGVSEDSGRASFAGLYESYLNLGSEGAILEAVLNCYRCLWHPRAVHYRAIKGVSHRGEAMATVIMQTVRSRVSGVAFTMNPVTGSTEEFVINASWGLGEAIVSGRVTPDSFTTDRTGRVLREEITHKALRYVPTGHGTEREETPADLASAPSLAPAQVREVAATARAVEELYGLPVDIEFAYDEAGTFYLLQARPVTTR